MDKRKLGETHDDDGSERCAGKKKTKNEVDSLPIISVIRHGDTQQWAMYGI